MSNRRHNIVVGINLLDTVFGDWHLQEFVELTINGEGHAEKNNGTYTYGMERGNDEIRTAALLKKYRFLFINASHTAP